MFGPDYSSRGSVLQPPVQARNATVKFLAYFTR